MIIPSHISYCFVYIITKFEKEGTWWHEIAMVRLLRFMHYPSSELMTFLLLYNYCAEGLSDPFCIVSVLDQASKVKKEKRTEVARRTRRNKFYCMPSILT